MFLSGLFLMVIILVKKLFLIWLSWLFIFNSLVLLMVVDCKVCSGVILNLIICENCFVLLLCG